MSEKRVLLIVGGGIAAYKALELTRLLRKAGVAVRPILTKAGAEFVTPLSLSALAEDKVYSELFSLTDEAEMGHIELSRSADLIVVAPATADLMAKAATGRADDLASTTLLATDTPILMAPAMNVRMWEHPATKRNLAQLKADGVAFVGPDEGAMACGEYGEGRLAEPLVIFEAVMGMLSGGRPLAGKRALVTAGPTVEAIDPVRLLTNRSSGKQGYAIARSLAQLGAEVTLVSGPTGLPAPAGVKRVDVESARDMLAACQSALPADVAVFVAAVADWRPDEAFGIKLKKGKDGPPALHLVENPDILATLAASGPQRPTLVVGFAAETNDVEDHARAKLARKGCDWIIANDVSQPGVMGGEENAVLLISKTDTERWERASKDAVARQIADRIAKALS
ncbi:bifunctional phosphopantothenoylcysteine decarboxylase/phosphopantothenate--cysteine ligase CoaBC [Caulobacter segnis]|uniref:bifunctional phosphopantothenoylcysteine decarboxylase/phosphopantothenate--cysteine ligase CoaBC n=1 Tax=Caulobacter segnis TaxID=88688 RepID=UPI00241012A3|nr:bifunctional phosphopantothenoylcysteine decarboxylase/phosphopantothenate--cysteine ligase CoaBC [Caulobacter segnis]MDG2521471.1 bifunctional phosphopantothenoylcysteine decarboxylase/phosphopantothenate--cysteine ligase CoaBC [Caulobacter segnis]